jgi:hypothetical protein
MYLLLLEGEKQFIRGENNRNKGKRTFLEWKITVEE